MNGSSMVPPVDTPAHGLAWLTFITHTLKTDTLTYGVYVYSLVRQRLSSMQVPHPCGEGWQSPLQLHLMHAQGAGWCECVALLHSGLCVARTHQVCSIKASDHCEKRLTLDG